MEKNSLIVKSNNVFSSTAPFETKELSFLIENSKIAAVGDYDEVSSIAKSKTKVIDFKDKFICPGFHDSHLHFFHTSLGNSPLLFKCVGKNEADLVKKTKEFAKSLPKNAWVLSQGWRYYRWNPKKYPSKHSLDKAFQNRPCAMYSGDGHTLWLNTCAMERLHILDDEKFNSQEGCERDENDELTGIFHEKCAMQLMPKCFSWISAQQLAKFYENQMKICSSQGITSICDMSLMPLEGCDFIMDEIYNMLFEQQKLTLRIHMFPTLLEDHTRLKTLRRKYKNNDYLYAPGFKQFFDGVSSEHTAYLSSPYTNAKFSGDCGQLTMPKNEMRKLVFGAMKEGFGVRIHTIGDGAISAALEIYKEGLTKFGYPKSCSLTLEHLENLKPYDIELLKETSTIASSQPCHITLDPGGPEKDLGDKRCALMWPFATFESHGIVQSFGSDSPITDINSMNVLYTATCRRDPQTHLPKAGWHPEQNISMATAIKNYTLGSAMASGNEKNIGSIEVGKFADFVILNKNLLELEEDEIQNAKIEATFVGGKQVY